MSFIIRRGLSTALPPKIASPQGINMARGAARTERIKNFYAKLPKGPPPEQTGGGFFGWYGRRYFGKNPSAAPIWHIIFFLMGCGYLENYVFHLRHHKHNAH